MRPIQVLPLACAALVASPDPAVQAADLAMAQAKAALKAKAPWVPIWRAKWSYLGVVDTGQAQFRLVWYEHKGRKGGQRLIILGKDGQLLAHWGGFRVAPSKLEGATLWFPEDIEEGNRVDFKGPNPPVEVWVSRAFHRHIATEQSDPVLRAAEEEEERREGHR
ncbi:MAG TPA: hypothetical protein VJ483_05345 [Holophagaceae bacterium]|nr:hypothetical protein [Holophagaceae bacterium]